VAASSDSWLVEAPGGLFFRHAGVTVKVPNRFYAGHRLLRIDNPEGTDETLSRKTVPKELTHA
jgi:hypothetical protein